MAEEIQQAVQIIRVAYDGIEIAMKIGMGTMEQMKKAVDMLIAVLEYEKTIGKTDMRKLLLKGGDLQVLQFATEDRKKVEKMAKKYGLLYSVLPDINKGDGMSEIVFHTEAVPRVNMMVQKLKSAQIATLDDYMQNGTEEELEKAMEFFKSQRGKSNGVPFEKKKEYQELMERMETIAATQGKELLPITITKKIVVEEKEQEFKTRVPGMWGKKEGYLWLPKEEILDIHDGKTILTFLECDKEYTLYAADNQVIGTMKGSELYEKHYDQVAKEVRDRYMKAGKKVEQKRTRRNPAAKVR